MVCAKRTHSGDAASGQEMRAEMPAGRSEEIIPVREINIFCTGKQDRFMIELAEIGGRFRIQTAHTKHDRFYPEISVCPRYKPGAAKDQGAVHLDG